MTVARRVVCNACLGSASVIYINRTSTLAKAFKENSSKFFAAILSVAETNSIELTKLSEDFTRTMKEIAQSLRNVLVGLARAVFGRTLQAPTNSFWERNRYVRGLCPTEFLICA